MVPKKLRPTRSLPQALPRSDCCWAPSASCSPTGSRSSFRRCFSTQLTTSTRSHLSETGHIRAPGHRRLCRQGYLPVSDPLGRHRHLARHRVRPAQRPVLAPGTPVVLLLSAQPHRRHHGQGHQRPESAVRNLLGPAIMYSANTMVFTAFALVLHAPDQPQADAVRIPSAARRQHRDPVLWPPDSRAL